MIVRESFSIKIPYEIITIELMYKVLSEALEVQNLLDGMQKMLDETSSTTPTKWTDVTAYPDISCQMALPVAPDATVEKSRSKCPSDLTLHGDDEICKSVITNPDLECFPARRM